jgi:hypothetical protein
LPPNAGDNKNHALIQREGDRYVSLRPELTWQIIGIPFGFAMVNQINEGGM